MTARDPPRFSTSCRLAARPCGWHDARLPRPYIHVRSVRGVDLLPLHQALHLFKRQFVLETLARCEGNRSRAAADLMIERTSLLRLIRELGITEIRAVSLGGWLRRASAPSVEREVAVGVSSKTCPRCHIDAHHRRFLQWRDSHAERRANRRPLERARRRWWLGTIRAGEATGQVAPLSSVPVPGRDLVGDYIRNADVAAALGKALFWDMQVGSDGVQACATCHFTAGADPRTKNQISPGLLRVIVRARTSDGQSRRGPGARTSTSVAQGPNATLTPADFPFAGSTTPQRESGIVYGHATTSRPRRVSTRPSTALADGRRPIRTASASDRRRRATCAASSRATRRR